MSIKSAARRGANKLLQFADLELVRRSRTIRNSQAGPDVKSYLDFEETARAAEESGMKIGEYVEATYQRPGDTGDTISKMIQLGILGKHCRKMCEIGPGSGRYLEKMIEACEPEYVEIYETAEDWSDWLVKAHGVVAQDADGRTLSATPSESLDLVAAHKTFVYTPFVTTCSYLSEIVRVIRPGGAVFFDAVTEACMDDEAINIWIESGSTYPCLLARQFLIDFLENRGFSLVDTFFIPMKPGRTECFAFIKEDVESP